MKRRRTILQTAFLAGLILLGLTGPAFAIDFRSQSLELLDSQEPPQLFWQMILFLDGQAGYPAGHRITFDIPEEENINIASFYAPSATWGYRRFLADPDLGMKPTFDRVVTGTTLPDSHLGGYKVYWSGEGPRPIFTQHYRVYDSSYNVVETGAFLVPEPDATLAQSLALVTLLLLLGRKKKDAMYKPSLASYPLGILGVLLLALPSPADATVIDIDPEDVVTHSAPLVGGQVEYTTVSYERLGEFAFDHNFELSAENLEGAPAEFTILTRYSQPCKTLSQQQNQTPLPVDTVISSDDFLFTLNGNGIQTAADPFIFVHDRWVKFKPEQVQFCAAHANPSIPDPAIPAIQAFIDANPINYADPDWRASVPKPVGINALYDCGRDYIWRLKTDWGTLQLKLYPETAPNHVTNAIYLSMIGFYDGLTFHRAIEGFMIQGGDHTGIGNGVLDNYAPGITGECSISAPHSKRGILSTANSGEGTDNSQFFITYDAQPHLDGGHTVFGELVGGTFALNQLENRSTADGTPTETLTIISATVVVE